MRALSPIIASNGFAIFLTIVFLLPITAIFAFVVTTPLDDAMANLGLWMHAQWQWSFPEFDTQMLQLSPSADSPGSHPNCPRRASCW